MNVKTYRVGTNDYYSAGRRCPLHQQKCLEMRCLIVPTPCTKHMIMPKMPVNRMRMAARMLTIYKTEEESKESEGEGESIREGL